jgi:hypothetical protein
MPTTKRKRLKPGANVILKLKVKQVDLIVEQTLIDDDLLASIHAAKVRDDVVSIKCTLDDLEELAGYVAAEANNTKDRTLRKELDAISDEIDRLKLSYVDTTVSTQVATAPPPHIRIVKR